MVGVELYHWPWQPYFRVFEVSNQSSRIMHVLSATLPYIANKPEDVKDVFAYFTKLDLNNFLSS